MSLVTEFHHAALIVSDLARSMAFYRELLELSVDEGRPDLGYPGAWLAVAGQQIHLLVLANPDPVTDRPAHPGHDRHIAFRVSDLSRLEGKLEAKGIPFSRSRSGRRALFCRDPDGNGLEFSETSP